MAGVRAIEGVDNTLVNVSNAAVAPLSPRPAVTVGPLDRDDDVLRLNWFLYSIQPNTVFRNMEPPLTGTRTRRGEPPLTLQLGYVLSAHPGTLTDTGQQAQFADRGLAAVMQALHDGPIINESSPMLAPEATPLVEPLRITMDALDLDDLSKFWTAASRPVRTTVGYRVTLTMIDSTKAFAAGPPVLERRLATAPSMGARIADTSGSRVAFGTPLDLEVLGATGTVDFTLRREGGDDPLGPDPWPLTATRTGANVYQLQVAPPTLAPGPRQLSVQTAIEGLPVGSDRAAITLVPVVSGPAGPANRGSTVSLSTAHVLGDVEVFLGGQRLPGSAVAFVSATQVDITIPAAATPGPQPVLLRSGSTAGPVFDGLVVT